MSSQQWDEWDGEVIDGVRFMNTFTANLAKNARQAGADEERKRILKIIASQSRHNLQCDGCIWCDVVYLINDRNVL